MQVKDIKKYMHNSSHIKSKRFSKSLWRLAAGLLIAQGVVWGSPVVAKPNDKPSDPTTLTYGELFVEVESGRRNGGRSIFSPSPEAETLVALYPDDDDGDGVLEYFMAALLL